MAQNIQFNDENNIAKSKKATGQGITGWMIKKGIVKSESQANLYLILVTIACIGIIVYQQFLA